MKKLGMLGIIGGAAILTAVPLSLQWSQKNVTLSLASAEAQERPLTATSVAGVSRRVHRRTYRRAAYASAVAGVGPYGYGSSLANCGYYLYRVPEIVTRGRFPDGGESDSTWRTQEARHVGSDTIAPG